VTFESLQYSTLYEIEPLIVDIYTNCLFMASSSYGLPFAMTSHVGDWPMTFSVDLTRVGSVEVGLRPPTFRNLSASGSDSSHEEGLANCTLVEQTSEPPIRAEKSIAWTQQVTLSIGNVYSIYCMPPSTIQIDRVGITAVYFPVVFFPSSQAGWTFTPNTSFMSILFDGSFNKLQRERAFWKANTYEAELEINDFPEYSRMMVSQLGVSRGVGRRFLTTLVTFMHTQLAHGRTRDAVFDGMTILSTKGVFVPPGSTLVPPERKLYLLIKGATEESVERTRLQSLRILEETAANCTMMCKNGA